MNDQVQEKDNIVLGLGIASLVFGTAALPLAFIPCCGTLAIIPAGLGLLFGAIGFFIAKSRKRSGGLCTAALVVSIIAGGIAFFQMIALGGMSVASASAANKSIGKSMDGREWGQLRDVVQQLQTDDGAKALYRASPELSQAYPTEDKFLQQARAWRPKLEPLPPQMPSVFTGKISYNVSVNGGFRKVELGYTNGKGGRIASRWENGRLQMISVD